MVNFIAVTSKVLTRVFEILLASLRHRFIGSFLVYEIHGVVSVSRILRYIIYDVFTV